MKTTITFLAFALLALSLQAQTVKVFGTVTEDTGLPLPGVNIMVKGTTTGTHTDFDGNYSISAQIGQKLIFAYVGFETKEVKIKKEGELNVKLQPSSNLEEVVVTGYSPKREKKSLSASVRLSQNLITLWISRSCFSLQTPRISVSSCHGISTGTRPPATG
ncbi:TonB-dependent receptor, partial [Vitellibacter sp. q18]|nr:TonB-dependent receptor [Aequorivita lutea]